MGFQDFISKSFGLTVPKIFVREPLSAVFHKIYGWEKDFDKGGGGIVKISTGKLSVPQCRKIP